MASIHKYETAAGPRPEVFFHVEIMRPRSEADQLAIIAAAYEAAQRGDTYVIYSTVDWPNDVVERVERAGAIYTTPGTVVEKLRTLEDL